MGLEYKIDVLDEMKVAGYSTDKLRRRGLLSESVIQHLRMREPISWASLEKVCSILNKQPGDIIAYNGDPDTPLLMSRKIRDQENREFEYLWWIWDTKFRKPGETMASFNPDDYKRYLPIPDDWEPDKLYTP